MTSSDIDWTVALRSSDPTEQASAVQGLRDLLHRGLKVALGGRSDVDDAHMEDFAQEALVRVMGRLDQFQGRSKFTTWAQSIAINTAFSELRRKRWQDVSLDAMLADGDRMLEPSFIPDDVLGASEERTRLVTVLREAIEKDLTPRQRAGILAELRELPFDQISALLGTSRNAAYKLLHDARQALKKRLTEAGITPEEVQSAFSV